MGTKARCAEDTELRNYYYSKQPLEGNKLDRFMKIDNTVSEDTKAILINVL